MLRGLTTQLFIWLEQYELVFFCMGFCMDLHSFHPFLKKVGNKGGRLQ